MSDGIQIMIAVVSLSMTSIHKRLWWYHVFCCNLHEGKLYAVKIELKKSNFGFCSKIENTVIVPNVATWKRIL